MGVIPIPPTNEDPQFPPPPPFDDEITTPPPNADQIHALFPPRPWGLGAVLAAIITALACLGVGLLVITLTVGEGGADSALVFNVSLIIIAVVLIPTAWLFGPAMHGGGLRALGLRPPQTTKQASWLLPPIAMIVMLAFNTAYVTLVNQLGIDWLTPPDLPFDEYGPLALTVAGIMVVIVGPFAEEVFFRGFVYSGLVLRWGVLAGLIVSALIFSLAHASVAILIPIFFAGVVLGWLYHRTGSLWGCVWVHVTQNAFAFAATLLL